MITAAWARQNRGESNPLKGHEKRPMASPEINSGANGSGASGVRPLQESPIEVLSKAIPVAQPLAEALPQAVLVGPLDESLPVPFARPLQTVQPQSIPISEPLNSCIPATSMPDAPVVATSLPAPASPPQPPVPSKRHSAAKPKESTAPIPYDPSGGLLRPVLIKPGTLLTDRYEQDKKRQKSIGSAVKGSPPWLVSLIIHMAAVVIFGLWMLATSKPETDILVDFTVGTDRPIENDVDLELPSIEDEVVLIEEAVAPLEELIEVPDPAPPVGPPPESFDGPLSVETEIAGIAGLEGRTPGMKKVLLTLYGGTPGTEAAVLEGLRWLKRTQNKKDGSWQMNHRSRASRNSGPWRVSSSRHENRAAATAMALMAYQGANHIGKKGEFKTTVLRGWRALLKMQDQRKGKFTAKNGYTNAEMYTHALCTIALCEMYAMTRESKYLIPAQKAVDFCVQTQLDDGGWKYNWPNQRSDLSVTGWVVMALQSARMAGIKVPEKTFEKIEKLLDDVARDEGAQYVYEPRENSNTSPALTAVGLLCRQYLGWKKDDPRLVRGVNYLLDNYPLSYAKPEKDAFDPETIYPPDVYYWYYISQVAHHMGSDHWTRWNKVMREEVPKHQVKKSGTDKGSWDPKDDRWAMGGRHYVTCLSIYMLEVYYRHMPLYTLKNQ